MLSHDQLYSKFAIEIVYQPYQLVLESNLLPITEKYIHSSECDRLRIYYQVEHRYVLHDVTL